MISKFLNALYSVLAISCFESIFNNDSTKIISKKGIQILENSTSEEIEEMIKKAQNNECI
jgi:hypothetical protein